MACGGCGKRRSQIKINREPIITGSVNMKSAKQCPICRSPMRSLHKYDKSIKKVIRSWYCTKPSCQNSRGTKNG